MIKNYQKFNEFNSTNKINKYSNSGGKKKKSRNNCRISQNIRIINIFF